MVDHAEPDVGVSAAATHRIAIITGAGAGQGRALLERLYRAGYVVVAVDKHMPNPIEESTVINCVADITDPVGIHAIADVLDRLGRCDVLYNNAAVYLAGAGDGSAHELSLEALEQTCEVNLIGAVRVSRLALPYMLRQRRGVIINVSSTGALLGSHNHAYALTKGALLALTRSMAVTYAPHGIRVVAISPGMVDTGMIQHITGHPNVYSASLKRIPAGRFATAEDIADVAEFLCSEAARYIHGANIVVDGGLVTA